MISVVIPVFNKRSTLPKLITSLRRELASIRAELIFICDNSVDGSAEYLSKECPNIDARLVVTQTDQPSASRNRNVGLRMASQPVCLFLDPDVILSAGFLSRIVMEAAKESNCVLLPEILGNSATESTWALAICDHELWEQMTDNQIITWARSEASLKDIRCDFAKCNGALDHLPAPWVFAFSCAIAARTDLFRSVGGFDERFTYKGSEDLELGYRLFKNGAKFRILRSASVFHIPHARDRLAEERRDRDHERLMLSLHTDVCAEALYAFDAVHCNSVLEYLGRHLADISQAARKLVDRSPVTLWDALPTHAALIGSLPRWLLDAVQPTQCISVDSTTNNSLSLVGWGLPFDDQSVDYVILAGIWQVLPEQLGYRCLDEALRVARRLLLIKSCRDSTRPLSAVSETAPDDHPYWRRSHRIRRSPYDFNVVSKGRSDDLFLLEVSGT